jgi:CheY-like chemotaxis protein
MITGARKGTVEKKILFVDDEADQRDVMKRILKKMGYDVTVSESSEKALEILAEDWFPLIITDLSMPGINGKMLCKKIRQTNSESVIYALSGYIQAFEAEKLETAGFDGYLRKPATSKMLVSAIEGAFEKLRLRRKN